MHTSLQLGVHLGLRLGVRIAEGHGHEAELADEAVRARYVADFIAGMTDTYAIKEHRRLFDRTPELG